MSQQQSGYFTTTGRDTPQRDVKVAHLLKAKVVGDKLRSVVGKVDYCGGLLQIYNAYAPAGDYDRFLG
jgi:hypothetical protein